MSTQNQSSESSRITLQEVKNRESLKKFLMLPQEVYRDDARFVPPLLVHVKMMMGKIDAPEKHFLLAYDSAVDKKNPVARIGFKVHRHGNKPPVLHFGFFECKKGHVEAVKAFINFARTRYPDLELMGPFQFRMEDPYIGILTEGFDRDPYFLMSYNPPYYAEYLEAAGLEKVMDLFTYQLLSKDVGHVEAIEQGAAKAKKAGVNIRPLNRSRLKEEARAIAGIFNDALSENWGYEEFLEDQINEMVTLFKLFIDPRVVTIAEFNGKPVGCLIMIPDFNPIIKRSKGRLTPTLIWRFLTQKKKLSNIRGYALGVLREYHGLGIGSALTDNMFKLGPTYGYERCEISWVLANNGPMNELSKAMGGKHDKIYRVFSSNPALHKKVEPHA